MNKPKDYLQDPDEEMEAIARISSEPVQAKGIPEADKKCQKLANQYNLELTGVERRGKNWFDCNFRG